VVHSIGGRTSRAARYYAEPSRLGLDEIDRQYGHLARDGREQATELLDSFAAFNLSRYMGASLT